MTGRCATHACGMWLFKVWCSDQEQAQHVLPVVAPKTIEAPSFLFVPVLVPSASLPPKLPNLALPELGASGVSVCGTLRT